MRRVGGYSGEECRDEVLVAHLFIMRGLAGYRQPKCASKIYPPSADLVTHMAFIRPDGSHLDFNSRDYVGVGTNGIVIRQGTFALKLAKVRDTSKFSEQEREDQDYINHVNCAILEAEKAVYRRIGPCHGIVQFFDSEEGILLEYVGGGDLETYIENGPEPEQSLKVVWIKSIINSVSHLHQSGILIDDIALRNLLITDDKSLKMVDFGQCTVFPEDTNMILANDNGMTVGADIFHLGCIIYSISAWRKYERNLFHCGYIRPALQDLPPTTDLLCGEVIEKCWSGQYQWVEEIFKDIHDQELSRMEGKEKIDGERQDNMLSTCTLPKSINSSD